MAIDPRAVRFADYARARVRVFGVDGLDLVLEPRHAGVRDGRFPFAGPAHVLTAFDPGPERPGAAVNEQRQRALVEELPTELRRWDAVAGAVDRSHEERSVVVVGLADEDARHRAARWQQDAIFLWTPDEWSIVPCDNGPRVRLGWTVREIRAGDSGERPRRPDALT